MTVEMGVPKRLRKVLYQLMQRDFHFGETIGASRWFPICFFIKVLFPTFLLIYLAPDIHVRSVTITLLSFIF